MNFLLSLLLAVNLNSKHDKQTETGAAHLRVDDGRGRQLVEAGGGERSEAPSRRFLHGLLWRHNSFSLKKESRKK